MKNVKIILSVLFISFMGSGSFAQTHDHSKMDMSKISVETTMIMDNTKTDSLKVSGNCNMCKTRIEKAAKIDGVAKVEWNKTNKFLTVTFDPTKTNMVELGKKVAAVGHDTEKTKASDQVYNKLPACCKYR